LDTTVNPTTPAAYQVLIDLAPDFLKEFTTRSGLSVNRYWREAVSRAGDVRSDRKTIPMVGALICQENIERFLRVIEYGQRTTKAPPPFILSVAPQAPYWGATSILKDTLAVLRRALVGDSSSADEYDARPLCVVPGKPPKFVQQAFDQIETIDTVGHSSVLEFLIIPNVAACVVVHSPVGASTGLAAPLGFASFDPDVLGRVQALIVDTTIRHVADQKLRVDLERGLTPSQQATDASPG
jgi:hypothetical protein